MLEGGSSGAGAEGHVTESPLPPGSPGISGALEPSPWPLRLLSYPSVGNVVVGGKSWCH